MGKRSRLEKYDPYPIDEIDAAINRWVKDQLRRRILRYILIDGYSYDATADLIAKDTGIVYGAKKMSRTITKAEDELFPHLKAEHRA